MQATFPNLFLMLKKMDVRCARFRLLAVVLLVYYLV